MKCWASVLGDCSAFQSREHYLSQGLWKGTSITVRGLWGESEERTIGINSFSAKILCTVHNPLLSPLDLAAIHLFETVDEIYRLYDVRLKLKRRKYWNVIKYQANGNLFERWAAKFIVGVFCVIGKDSYWHQTRTGPLEPPAEIVKAIYGIEQFKEPAGLYMAFAAGDKYEHDDTDRVHIETLMHPDEGLVGANIDFKGFRFLIWLSSEPIHSYFVESSAGTVFGPGAEELMYRPRVYRFAIANVLSQKLIYEWHE